MHEFRTRKRLVGSLREQNPGSQGFEAIATPQPVHNPDQTVQTLGAGVRNRVLEGVYFSGLPIRKCPDQVRVGLPHLGNHSLAPGLVGSDGPKIPENGLRLKRSFSTPSESRQKRDNLPTDRFQNMCARSLDNYRERDFGKKLVTR